MAREVRWGILGTGRIAALFAADLRRVPGARLAAVASRRPDGARAFAAAHGVLRVHTDASALVADPGVDLVYVASPPARHLEHALLCLDNGKPVVVEKPFALNARQGREVVGRARQRGLFCMEAMWMRFTPAALALEALIADGGLGEIQFLEASLGWPNNPSGAAFDPTQGGGALLDLGVYPVSMAVWLLGQPTSVAARAVRLPSGVDAQVSAVLGFASGAQAMLAASLQGLLSNRAVITGARGRLDVREPFLRPERFSVMPFAAPASTGGNRGWSGRPGALSRVARHRLLAPARQFAAWLSDRNVARPVTGHGYAHEAAEAMRALVAGETESPRMPLADTLVVLETLDAVRAAIDAADAGAF